jgi:DNA invertase Pin-like site-specific DNA recombinase
MAQSRVELLTSIRSKLQLVSTLSRDVDALIELMKGDEAQVAELRTSLGRLFPGSMGRIPGRRGRPPANGTGSSDGSRKRGRAFKFSDEQAADFRRQVEGGKSTAVLAKELKVSVPTMYNTLKRAGWKGRSGRVQSARTARAQDGGAKKRGGAFKFTEEQAAGFRKRVENGTVASALAKELKVSLPTVYSTLKRAGWKGRRARVA